MTHWIQGMDPCKWCGGSHLHRDCQTDAGKEAAGGSHWSTGALTFEVTATGSPPTAS